MRRRQPVRPEPCGWPCPSIVRIAVPVRRDVGHRGSIEPRDGRANRDAPSRIAGRPGLFESGIFRGRFCFFPEVPMSWGHAVALILAAATAGCGSAAGGSLNADGRPDRRSGSTDFDAVARGRVVYENACVRCHSIDPPTASAPPLRRVAGAYRSAATEETAAVNRIADWIASPAAEFSLLPGEIERSGVMPRVALDGDLYEAVARYVWSLGEVADSRGGPGGPVR